MDGRAEIQDQIHIANLGYELLLLLARGIGERVATEGHPYSCSQPGQFVEGAT